jgi:ribose-phosphate pyrophosphokinase
MKPILFSLDNHPLFEGLFQVLNATLGECAHREFPDGESYLRIITPVKNQHCIIVANLVYPNEKFLPLIFLADTLKELGALSVGLVTPYLSYMRQDIRFLEGEAVTSKIFAKALCQHIDWLVTVDPHLHRYHSLNEIYSIPTRVVQGAPLLADWLKQQKNILLIGPDEESEQWVSSIAKVSEHPYVIGHKDRKGDRNVEVTLPDLTAFIGYTAVIIDDVVSSGQTLLKCIEALKLQGITQVNCAAVHGIFADNSDEKLMAKGVVQLITTNSIPHNSNVVDLSSVLKAPIEECLALQGIVKE